jgi:hypothetical protein
MPTAGIDMHIMSTTQSDVIEAQQGMPFWIVFASLAGRAFLEMSTLFLIGAIQRIDGALA